MIRCGILANYKGLWFATFDAAAPPLRDYLGEMAWYLDAFFDRRDGGIEVIGGMHKWVMPCNWKFPAENFGGDGYHTSWSHLSAIQTGSGGNFRLNPDPRGVMLSPGNGHCVIGVGPDTLADPPASEILAYEDQIRPEMEQRLGPRLNLVKPIVGTVFPNFSLLRPTSRTFRVWHPRGPDKTEVWAWVYVDKRAPPEVKEAIRLAGVRVFGPAGTFEQDDMDNWQGCTQTGRGTVGRPRQHTFPDRFLAVHKRKHSWSLAASCHARDSARGDHRGDCHVDAALCTDRGRSAATDCRNLQ